MYSPAASFQRADGLSPVYTDPLESTPYQDLSGSEGHVLPNTTMISILLDPYQEDLCFLEHFTQKSQSISVGVP